MSLLATWRAAVGWNRSVLRERFENKKIRMIGKNDENNENNGKETKKNEKNEENEKDEKIKKGGCTRDHHQRAASQHEGCMRDAQEYAACIRRMHEEDA